MTSKKIAVLGGGNGAHMMAADLTLKGHEVRLFEMPQFKQKMQQVFDTRTIKVSGIMSEIVKISMVTDNIEEAIDGVRYICVVTPAFAHESIANLLRGKVKRDQIITVFPGGFAALLFKKTLGGEDCPVIADVNNLPYDTRLLDQGHVALYGRNRINISFLPAEKGKDLIEEMREDLFPFEKVYTDVLEAGFSIVNPAIHTGVCLLNISNIESHLVNFYFYEHGVTPSSMKLDIAIDNERKAIGRVFGYNLRPIEDFSGLNEGYTWEELYQALHGSIALTPICGPNDINNRYMTEDVPYGLVPWSSIGKVVGVKTPVMDSMINIYNIIHGKDWRKIGNTAEKLGLADMTVQEILDYVKN